MYFVYIFSRNALYVKLEVEENINKKLCSFFFLVKIVHITSYTSDESGTN